MASPSGVFGPVLAYRVPALPPSALIFTASAMASIRVDFPEPFSPTRKVIGRRKASPRAARCSTAARVKGQPSGCSRPRSILMCSMNTDSFRRPRIG